ncbi:hypothetical protein HYPSUDRAFT_46730 [Hypholoma sublateritium FD-334 SS-4]|uniref:Uncharacterized protein n=1 Tax=Hypholoma sublateritium (strain FD-334 SS-4) TaxID=945553 RepID=A0A0D2P9R0_HYPSF|nr:hypothetical protein HYPSUDRAFT_46730 [Hypholoma sublateritium FD-334 SS-4]
MSTHIQPTIRNWDKLSSNGYVSKTGLDLKEHSEGALHPDPRSSIQGRSVIPRTFACVYLYYRVLSSASLL